MHTVDDPQLHPFTGIRLRPVQRRCRYFLYVPYVFLGIFTCVFVRFNYNVR
jgi:hypothetical protein